MRNYSHDPYYFDSWRRSRHYTKELLASFVCGKQRDGPRVSRYVVMHWQLLLLLPEELVA